jgi:hypothetical protein
MRSLSTLSHLVLPLALAAGLATQLEAGEGLSFTNPVLHPGKLDFHLHDTRAATEPNLMWWTPSVKAGFGLLSPDQGDDVRYYGGFFRPLAARPKLGDLIVGLNRLDAPAGDDLEIQAEYRLPAGLGFGGGLVDREGDLNDVRFAKVSYRSPGKGWRTIATLQAQEVGEETSPGGYLALFDDELMLVAGHDGEQWRATLGYVAPQPKVGRLRPAVEVLYVDNTVGDRPGPETLFANATLGFTGGFLSHPARLGRAMGPTGLEFGNPLGFLNPTWNRRLDTWEMGGIAGFRIVGSETPTGLRTVTYEALVFPFQLAAGDSLADRFFAGATFTERSRGNDVAGAMAGYYGKISFLTVTLAGEYEPETGDRRLHLGLIDTF